MKAENAEYLFQTLKQLDIYLESRDSVSTPFGPQDPKQGYQIKQIYVGGNWIRVELYMCDRKIREQDKWVREGDVAAFRINKNLIEEQLD